jgi:hypothetical protein
MKCRLGTINAKGNPGIVKTVNRPRRDDFTFGFPR